MGNIVDWNTIKIFILQCFGIQIEHNIIYSWEMVLQFKQSKAMEDTIQIKVARFILAQRLKKKYLKPSYSPLYGCVIRL